MESDEKQMNSDFAESGVKIAGDSKILMEGRLSIMKDADFEQQWWGDTYWYILRKVSSNEGSVNMEQHSIEPEASYGKDTLIGSINISADVQRISVISGTETNELRNQKNVYIPPNLRFTDDIKSQKPYAFIIQTQRTIHVFSALEFKPFIQWIQHLNRAVSYMNPFQVAAAFRVLAAVNAVNDDNKQISTICSFLIDNYCDSARVHLIPRQSFCTGKRGDVVTSRILSDLRVNIPSVSMGWDGVVVATEQQIDKRLANLIKFVSPMLPNLSPESMQFMTKIFRKNTNHALTAGETQYIDGLINRTTKWNMDTIRTHKSQEMTSLSIYNHRGHIYISHPRNVLDDNVNTAYTGLSPAVGDWITFKIESQHRFIPGAVVFGNDDTSYGLRSVELSLASEYGNFESLAVIHDILNIAELQQFELTDVKIDHSKLCANNYKLIRLKVLDNWGSHINSFYHFSLLGYELSERAGTMLPELNATLLRDIFNTHKVFIFASFNQREYTLNDFVNGARTFGVKEIFNAEHNDEIDLFPTYLFKDDIFEVCGYLLDASDGVNKLLQSGQFNVQTDIFCGVIPEKVVSVYDLHMIYHLNLDHLGELIEILDANENLDIVAILKSTYQTLTSKQERQYKVVATVIDRRFPLRKKMYVLGFADLDEFNKFDESQLIGIFFSMTTDTNKEDNKVVKAWLHHGSGQCLRFWPEHLIWFIPRLFVKSKKRGYKFFKKLYAEDYKHGFCVNLDDPTFNRYYKMLTGWDHQSVNYRRSEKVAKGALQFGLRDQIQNRLRELLINKGSVNMLRQFLEKERYCSDAICDDLEGRKAPGNSNIANLKLHAVTAVVSKCVRDYKDHNLGICTVDHFEEIWHCPIARQLTDALRRFDKLGFIIKDDNTDEFDHSIIIRGLDHLIEVHNMFSIRNRARIQHHFMKQVPCIQNEDCAALRHHCSRRRENDKIGLQQSVEAKGDDEITMAVTQDVLSSTHCYLLHSEEPLYRLSGQSAKFEMSPFSTPVNDEEFESDDQKGDDAPPPIDFGTHILQWLPYGVGPHHDSFQEEMLRNPQSTIPPELWDEYRLKCVALVDGVKWTMEHLEELMCLKLYSDCTVLQSLFRKAHWKNASLETKRAFYQWGLMMYKTFLFHARPIVKQPNSALPHTLYHGLNKVFRIENVSSPTYQGPFSTTMSSHVANGFAKGQGLVFNIKGSYTNPLQSLIGINMIRISCFKHEQEVLLYSQTLPIEKTKNFEQGDDKSVDLLVFTLISVSTEILDATAFFRRVGIKFSPSWWPLIVTHPHLMKDTDFEAKTVLQRLQNELEFENKCGESWTDWKPIRGLFMENAFDDIINEDLKIYLPRGGSNENTMTRLSYSVEIAGILCDQYYQFQDKGYFQLNTKNMNPFAPNVVRLRVKPNERASQSLVIREFDSIQCPPFGTYKINQTEPLVVATKLKVSDFNADDEERGFILIDCDSQIKIAADSGVIADAAGLREKENCLIYDKFVAIKVAKQKENVLLTFGTTLKSQGCDVEQLQDVDDGLEEYEAKNENKSLFGKARRKMMTLLSKSKKKTATDPYKGGGNTDIVSLSSPEADAALQDDGSGGIIALLSRCDIVNDGVLSSNGSAIGGYGGGSIYLCADGAVVNHGVIRCRPNGRLIVQCRQFVSEGVMSPEPEVFITDGTELTEIEVVLMPWCRSEGASEEIPLSIYRHRGHYKDYHPRNLLDKKGTETRYESEFGTTVGDWITFEIESPFIVIPKAVIIRNHYACGLKSISLSLSVDGDEFEDFAVIQDIHSRNREEQYLNLKDVTLSNSKIWMKDYKYLKLTVIENWGRNDNRFYSFSLFGVLCSE